MIPCSKLFSRYNRISVHPETVCIGQCYSIKIAVSLVNLNVSTWG